MSDKNNLEALDAMMSEAKQAAKQTKTELTNAKFKARKNNQENASSSNIIETTKESIGSGKQKKIRVTLSLTENMFYALENECKKIGATKNGYIVNMLSKKFDIDE